MVNEKCLKAPCLPRRGKILVAPDEIRRKKKIACIQNPVGVQYC
jgi:hypothetical protein